MCCIVASLFRICVIIISVFIIFVIALKILLDQGAVRQYGSVKDYPGRITIWFLHCFCGILMTVLKLKDICYLHWWQLITLAFLIGGFGINYLQSESDDFGLGQKVLNYFVLEYMLLTLLTVSFYTRDLKSQQEV